MVKPKLTPGTKPAQHIDEIRRAAERARDLIDHILTFGRRRDARVRSVQVRTLFEEAASLLHAALPQGVELIIENVPGDVTVSGEPAQLQQVILNLCTNAAQAMAHSGNIRVTAEQKDVAAFLQLSHGELTPGRYVCLAVVDSGHGFDDSVARRLFEPFFTTRLTGTGLGLATVYEIVRDHDGAMNVQSEPGHGCRFEAWLPAAGADSTTVVGPAMLPLGRGETVLVVESEREQLLRRGDAGGARIRAGGVRTPIRCDRCVPFGARPVRYHSGQPRVAISGRARFGTRATRDNATTAPAARYRVHDRCQRRSAGGSRDLRSAAPAPGQYRTRRCAGALPAIVRHVTAVTRLPIAEILL